MSRAQASNRHSRWALENGIGVGDCVCLLMPNRSEYVAIWLGISRVGGIVALPQHQPSRRRARSLRRRCSAAAHSTLLAEQQRFPQHRQRLPMLVLRRQRARVRAHRARSILIFRRSTQCHGAADGRGRRLRPLHLHLGHDRPAEGGKREPLSHHDLEPLVCRG